MKTKQEKTTQVVKTTPHINQGKGATLVSSTVKLLHQKRKGKLMGIKGRGHHSCTTHSNPRGG